MPRKTLACFLVLAPTSFAATAADANPAIAQGRQLLGQYHCGTCHTIPGVPAARATFAADLSAYGRRSYLIGRWPNQPQMLARWIVDPAALAPGTLMPSMGVSPEDAQAMAAYLLSLRE